ncbi:MAG: ABC transporter permease [Caldilineales bacterium]|nr:ABC transporter permease [Caldilineales bacterium]
MAKAWLVARAEYLNQVRRRSFLVATLAVPLLIVAVIVISALIAIRHEEEARPLGYVDQSGLLTSGVLNSAGDFSLRAYASESAARSALAAGEIQGYYLLPPDYGMNGQAHLYYWRDPPSSAAQDQFEQVVRLGLLAGQPEAVQKRLSAGLNLTLRSLDGKRYSGENDVGNFLLPLVVGLFFVFIVMGSAGYMLRAVTTEKESRTVEVLFTSLSPGQLVGGKAIGLMAVALSQVALWLAVLAAAVLVAARHLDWLASIRPTWALAGIIFLYFLPTYALVAGLMTTLGSLAPDQQQGQQIAGVVNILFTLPFFFIIFLFTQPDSPLMVGMTLFPTTAFITIAMRWGATSIPAWQLALSWSILVLSAAGSVFIAARVFRMGMLRYGQTAGASLWRRRRARRAG